MGYSSLPRSCVLIGLHPRRPRIAKAIQIAKGSRLADMGAFHRRPVIHELTTGLDLPSYKTNFVADRRHVLAVTLDTEFCDRPFCELQLMLTRRTLRLIDDGTFDHMYQSYGIGGICMYLHAYHVMGHMDSDMHIGISYSETSYIYIHNARVHPATSEMNNKKTCCRLLLCSIRSLRRRFRTDPYSSDGTTARLQS